MALRTIIVKISRQKTPRNDIFAGDSIQVFEYAIALFGLELMRIAIILKSLATRGRMKKAVANRKVLKQQSPGYSAGYIELEIPPTRHSLAGVSFLLLIGYHLNNLRSRRGEATRSIVSLLREPQSELPRPYILKRYKLLYNPVSFSVNDHHQRWWLAFLHLEGALVLI